MNIGGVLMVCCNLLFNCVAIAFHIMLIFPVYSLSENYVATASSSYDYVCRVKLVDIVQEIDRSLLAYPEGSLFELNSMLQKRFPMKCTRKVFMKTVLESKTLKVIQENSLVLIANFENGSASSGLGFRLSDDLIELGWAHILK